MAERTIRVRITQPWVWSGQGEYAPGDELELSAAMAAQVIEGRVAVQIESAAVAVPETAALPKAKSRQPRK